MKARFLYILLLISVITTACNSNIESKQYSSVDEYEKAMKTVQSKYPAFKFFATKYSKKNGQEYRSKMEGYIKGNMMKDDIIMSPVIKSTAVYDGTTTYINNKNVPNWPNEFFLPYTLTKWNANDTLQGVKSKVFTSKQAEVNGIPCRMIEYKYLNGNNIEVCISDKYGVAVYYNFMGYRNIGGRVFDKDIYEERIEVSKIESSDLNDSIFR